MSKKLRKRFLIPQQYILKKDIVTFRAIFLLTSLVESKKYVSLQYDNRPKAQPEAKLKTKIWK